MAGASPTVSRRMRIVAVSLFVAVAACVACLAYRSSLKSQGGGSGEIPPSKSAFLGQREILQSANCPPPCVPHVFDRQEEAEMEGLMGKGKIGLPTGQEAVAAAIRAATDANEKAASADGSAAAARPMPPQAKVQAPIVFRPGQYVSQWQMMHGGNEQVDVSNPASGSGNVVSASGNSEVVSPMVTEQVGAQAQQRTQARHDVSKRRDNTLDMSQGEDRGDLRGSLHRVGEQHRGRAQESRQEERQGDDGRSSEYGDGHSDREVRKERSMEEFLRRLIHGDNERMRRGVAVDDVGEQRTREQSIPRDGDRLSSKLSALLRLFIKSHSQEDLMSGETWREGRARREDMDDGERSQGGDGGSSTSSLERLLGAMVEGRRRDRDGESFHDVRDQDGGVEGYGDSLRRGLAERDGSDRRGSRRSRRGAREHSGQTLSGLGRLLAEAGMWKARGSDRGIEEARRMHGGLLRDAILRLERHP